MVRVSRAVAVVAAGVFAVAGCGADAGTGSDADTPPPAVTSAAAASSEASPTARTAGVPQTLRFTATTVDGKPFDAATLAGKPVVLWFWAAWCPRCRAAADDVAAVNRDFAGRVQVVGVAGLGSGDEPARKFVADEGVGGFVNLADDKGEVWKRFEVTSQEQYVLIDRAGTITHKGALTPQELRDRVTALAR